MLDLLKKVIPHLGTSGVTVLVLYGLLAGQVQQANTRSDSAMIQAAQVKGVVDGIDQNLKWFMLNQGVDPIEDPVPAETVTVWRYVDVLPTQPDSLPHDSAVFDSARFVDSIRGLPLPPILPVDIDTT